MGRAVVRDGLPPNIPAAHVVPARCAARPTRRASELALTRPCTQRASSATTSCASTTWTTRTRTGSSPSTARRTACLPRGALRVRRWPAHCGRTDCVAATRFEAMLWKLELACANAQAQVSRRCALSRLPAKRRKHHAHGSMRLPRVPKTGACRDPGDGDGAVTTAAKLRRQGTRRHRCAPASIVRANMMHRTSTRRWRSRPRRPALHARRRTRRCAAPPAGRPPSLVRPLSLRTSTAYTPPLAVSHFRLACGTAVYEYWLDKRKRLGKPALRRLQPPPAVTDPNPFNVFRPREKLHRHGRHWGLCFSAFH